VSEISKKAVPKLAADVDWKRVKLSADEGFIMSRVDGKTSLGEIILLVPFPEPKTIAVLTDLHARSVIEIPGLEKPASDGIELAIDVRRRIDSLEARILDNNPFALLGVHPGVEKRDLKKAYFLLSKEFHPDRYFGKKLGPYHRRMQDVFTAITAAFEMLNDPEKRAEAEREAKERSSR
jgi:hypothetical protein